MNDQKIINNNHISWQDEENARLDYRVVFDDGGYSDRKEEQEVKEEVDVTKMLRERDRQWISKLKNAREVAFNQGVEKGRMKGLEEARAELSSHLSVLENAIEQAQQEWRARQEVLDPGLLDLAFDIAETILGIPVENPEIRKKMENELAPLLESMDEYSKPLLRVSESDYAYVEKLGEEYAPETTIKIRVSEDCNPGEFELETGHESVVLKFRKALRDFKDKLMLPSWT